jgi:hypothetical protein
MPFGALSITGDTAYSFRGRSHRTRVDRVWGMGADCFRSRRSALAASPLRREMLMRYAQCPIPELLSLDARGECQPHPPEPMYLPCLWVCATDIRVCFYLSGSDAYRINHSLSERCRVLISKNVRPSSALHAPAVPGRCCSQHCCVV